MNLVRYIAIFILLPVLLQSQEEETRFSFTRYGIEDGLPNMSMDVLGRDSLGFLWLANPLTRFDGQNFKTFKEDPKSPSSSLITAVSMTDDGEGNLFFASQNGIYYYDTSDQLLHKLPSIPFNSSARTILKTDAQTFWDYGFNHLYRIDFPDFDTTKIIVPELFDAKQISAEYGDTRIWFMQRPNKIMYLDLTTLELVTTKEKTVQISEKPIFVRGRDNKFWMITPSGIYLYDEKNVDFQFIFDFASLDQIQGLNFETSTIQIGKDNLWIVDRTNHYVHKYDIKTSQVNSIRIGDDISYALGWIVERRAIETQDGSLLIGTKGKGLIEVDPETGFLRQYYANPNNENSLLCNHTIPKLSCDQHTFFVVGVGQGLIKIDLKKPIFKQFSPPGRKSNDVYALNVRSILEWQEDVVIGSITGINLFDKESQKFKSLPIPGNEILLDNDTGAAAIAKDSEENLLIIYWVLSEKAYLYYLDYKHGRVLNLKDTFPETSSYSSNVLFTDSKNNFWISIQAGVIKIAADFLAGGNMSDIRQQAEFYDFNSFRPSKLDLHKIFAIAEDKFGSIWVGTSEGLYKIDPSSKEIEAFLSSRQDDLSLSANHIRSIYCAEDGIVWVGTYNGGLNRYNPTSKTFERFSTNSGLPDNTIYSIAEDADHKLWLGTNKGLCWFDPINKHSQQYLPSDGVQHHEFNTNAVCKTKDGTLFFGGINGFNMFSPEKISSAASSANLVFTSVTVNNEDISLKNNSLDLEHDENFISFEFALLDYYNNDKIQYTYKLAGLEEDWNYLRDNRRVSYPGLNPGTYEFQVKAASHNGLWSEKMLSARVKIHAPWWSTWWFMGMSTFMLGGIIYLLYRNKEAQKEKITQLRNRISKDLHDEIGSTLSSISLFGTVAKKMVDSDVEGGLQMLDRINDSTTQVMESMNDIVWAINSDNDKIDSLFKRMRAFASELSDASSIKLLLDIDDKIKETPINMVQRRNVYLIYKEAINNAFKYSGATQIKVRLSQDKTGLHMTIQDDGVGFDLESLDQKITLGGNGLKNMMSRSRELDGELKIESKRDGGTVIAFTWNPKFEPKLNK